MSSHYYQQGDRQESVDFISFLKDKATDSQ